MALTSVLPEGTSVVANAIKYIQANLFFVQGAKLLQTNQTLQYGITNFALDKFQHVKNFIYFFFYSGIIPFHIGMYRI